jgi:hypothetical protein
MLPFFQTEVAQERQIATGHVLAISPPVDRDYSSERVCKQADGKSSGQRGSRRGVSFDSGPFESELFAAEIEVRGNFRIRRQLF